MYKNVMVSKLTGGWCRLDLTTRLLSTNHVLAAVFSCLLQTHGVNKNYSRFMKEVRVEISLSLADEEK